MDYIVGIVLIAAPWLLGFARNETDTWLPAIAGIVVIVYSLLTNYEAGLARMISMRTHLTLDFLVGAVLAVSPWLFNFNEYVYWPHLIVGLLMMGLSLTTETVPHEAPHATHRPGTAH